MKPIAPLMAEHRLIERMLALIGKELGSVERGAEPDIAFLRDAVDFFRTYADRTHHGKEEDVFFRELSARQLSEEHRKVIGELMEEHVAARKHVSALSEACGSYADGEGDAVSRMIASIRALCELYPWHIEKEDRHLFIPALDYFSDEEQTALLREFYSFDRNMIHEKYKKVVEEYNGK